METARSEGTVYGATTGVGANKDVDVDEEQGEHPRAHGLRLLRSHAASLGPVEDEPTTRAALVLRLNQLLAGARVGRGRGVSPAVLDALADAVETGALPTLHRFGGIGTSDLAPLAELGLTLVGERPWRTGSVPPVALGAADALPLISSHALTLATASLALVRLRQLLVAGLGISALSFLALRGNPQAWSPAVHAARPHARQPEVAAALHALVEGGPEPTRLQDPFALRTHRRCSPPRSRPRTCWRTCCSWRPRRPGRTRSSRARGSSTTASSTRRRWPRPWTRCAPPPTAS